MTAKIGGAANPVTKTVAQFVSGLSAESIPEPVLRHAKYDILDCIGCALFGQTLPITRILAQTYSLASSQGSVSVWGTKVTAPAEIAAIINGTSTHSFELDDLHAKAILHPGGTTLPAAMAIGQLTGATGGQLVAAHVAGLEVSSRVGLAAGGPILRRGWHNNGVLGVFGAASAASNLLGLSPAQTVNALGTAGSLASGLMGAQYGAMVKRLHAGQAAQSGLKAALLASNGFTGIQAIFEEEYGGFLSTFSDNYHLEEVRADLGTRWETTFVGFKPYAACGSSHTTIDVLLGLRREHGLKAEDIRKITVRTSTTTLKHVGWGYLPDSVVSAQMNLPYVAALALVDGSVFVDGFTDERLKDSRLMHLANRVEVRSDTEIDGRGPSHRHEVFVSVEMLDGKTLTGHAVHARGSADAPLSESDLMEKFEVLASHHLARGQVLELAGEIMALDKSPNLSRLTALLQPD